MMDTNPVQSVYILVSMATAGFEMTLFTVLGLFSRKEKRVKMGNNKMS